MNKKVLIADDHQVVLDGLSALINSMRGFEVMGAAKNGWEVLEFLEQHGEPDLLLMDITMPSLDGMDTMAKLKENGSQLKVIILSMHLSTAFAKQLLALGVKGYLQKDCDRKELKAALQQVSEGETFLSRNMTELLVIDRETDSMHTKEHGPNLTAREGEILVLLQQELSSREIGERLGISFNTVETHRKHLLNKFAVSSTIGLVREAMRCGLLD